MTHLARSARSAASRGLQTSSPKGLGAGSTAQIYKRVLRKVSNPCPWTLIGPTAASVRRVHSDAKEKHRAHGTSGMDNNERVTVESSKEVIVATRPAARDDTNGVATSEEAKEYSIIDPAILNSQMANSRTSRLSTEVFVGRRDKRLVSMPRSLAMFIEGSLMEKPRKADRDRVLVREVEDKLAHINAQIEGKSKAGNQIANAAKKSGEQETTEEDRPYTLPAIKKRDLVDLAFEINRRYLPEPTFKTKESTLARRKLINTFGINDPKARKQILEEKRALPLLYDEQLTSSYVSGMSALSFSSIANVLMEITRRDPMFEPKSVLDFGCGPGTAMWASNIYFGNSLEKYTGIDISVPMLKTCERMCKEEFGIENLTLKRYLNLILAKQSDRHDLVTCNFVLGEIPKELTRLQIARALWEHTSDTLVIVDRANKKGFQSLLRIRSMILDMENGTNVYDDSHIEDFDDDLFEKLFPGKKRNNGFEINEKLHHLKKKAERRGEDTSRDVLLKKLELREGESERISIESGVSQQPTLKTKLTSQDEGDALISESIEPAEGCQLISRDGEPAKSGAYVFAPCPHEFKCPMAQRGLCSNMQLYEKPHFEMELKRSKDNHSFAHFTYLVIRRGQRPAKSDKILSRTFHWPRLVEMPMKRKQHVVFTWCSPEGNLEKTAIGKSKVTTQQYRDARKSSINDIWPHKPVNRVVDVNKLREQIGEGVDNGMVPLRTGIHGRIRDDFKGIEADLSLSDNQLSEMDLTMGQDVPKNSSSKANKD